MISNSAHSRTKSRLYIPADGGETAQSLLAAMPGYWTAEGYSGSGALINQGTITPGAVDMNVTTSGPPLFLASAARNYLYQPLTQIPTCNTADNDIYTPTTALDVRVAVAATDWTPSAEGYLLGHWVSGSASWLFGVGTDGKLKTYMSTDGSTNTAAVSTAAPSVSDGGLLGVRATWTNSPAEVKFFTKAITAATAKSALDDSTGWTQLGTTITVDVKSTALFNSTSALGFGSGLTGATTSVAGKYYYGYVSVDGTVRVTFDPALGTGNATSWTSAEGTTITMSRPTTGIIMPLVEVGKSIFLFDGVDDYITCADNAGLDFAAAAPFSVGSIFRIWGTPLNTGSLFQKFQTAGNLGYVTNGTTTLHSLNFVLGDGAAFPSATTPASSAGLLRMQGGVRSVALDQIFGFLNSTLSAPTTDSTTGTLVNTAAPEIGRYAGVQFPRMEWLGAFVSDVALTSAQLGLIAALWGL